MGQNYIGDTYRKTYEGDYVKSYENKTLAKKELERRVKSYKEITQKEGTYRKQEKGVFDPGNTERTIDILDKPVRKVPDRKPSKQEQKPIQKMSSNKPVIKQTKPVSTSVPTPPPAPLTKVEREEVPKPITKPAEVKPDIKNKEQNVQKTDNVTRDYEAYRTLVIVPIKQEANGIYREMVNKELVDEGEARKILAYAGYKEKKSLDFIKFGLLAFFATIILQLLGAIGALVWAYFFRQRTHVILEKKMGFSNLTIRMPANKQEKEQIQANGMIYMGIAAVMFFVAVIRMYVS